VWGKLTEARGGSFCGHFTPLANGQSRGKRFEKDKTVKKERIKESEVSETKVMLSSMTESRGRKGGRF
jgi:hypothetical protein